MARDWLEPMRRRTEKKIATLEKRIAKKQEIHSKVHSRITKNQARLQTLANVIEGLQSQIDDTRELLDSLNR